MEHTLKLTIQPQPTDSTCGHTCLHAVYGYWGDFVPLSQIIDEIGQLRDGGTLAVQLACHALARGYDATIYTYNLFMFDPTWLRGDGVDLPAKLRAQCARKKDTDHRIAIATENYLRFLELGGRLKMEPLEEPLIVHSLLGGVPILSGLSATFLYQESRERALDPPRTDGISATPDDVGGFPVGHFVVFSGYDQTTGQVLIADPMSPNPMAARQVYTAPLSQVTAAVFLGIATYDANLLMIEPRQPSTAE